MTRWNVVMIDHVEKKPGGFDAKDQLSTVGCAVPNMEKVEGNKDIGNIRMSKYHSGQD